MRAITLDQLNEANIHLMGAKAILKVLEIVATDEGLGEVSGQTLGEALHGVGLLLDSVSDAVNESEAKNE